MTFNAEARFGNAWQDGNTPEINIPRNFLNEPQDSAPLLEPPETTAIDYSKLSYRERFMAGKWQEYLATEEAYKEIYGSPSNGHLYGIRHCRKFATFASNADTAEVKVMASSCRDRWCPMCAAEKASFANKQTLAYLQGLRKPRFLTLTLKHSELDLAEQLQFLQECFRKLRSRVYWKAKIKGGIWFLQVHRSESDGLWHPHLHIVIDGYYVEQAVLSDLWKLVTYGSLVLDIRRIHDAESTAQYVSRYASRPARLEHMPLADRVEMIESLHGKRLCGTFGTAKCVTLTPPKVERDGEWQEVGFYDEINKKAASNPDYKAVLEAYHLEQPLSDEIFNRITGVGSRAFCSNYDDTRQVQLYLDFFKGS